MIVARPEPCLHFGEATWREIEALDRPRTVLILPTGAVEAHGPHLPLNTDGLIAGAMAVEGARRLAGDGIVARVLPGLDYTAAPFARDFPGTISVRPETFSELVVDVGRALAGQGFRWLALANAHLDPAHRSALRSVVERLERDGEMRVVFPDVTRRYRAEKLGEEFRSGACHAGRYEGSLVLAVRPEAVRRSIAESLAPNPASLSEAIGRGQDSFREAGGPEAYFGDPASATAAEGRRTLEILGEMLREAVLERWRLEGEDGTGGER